MIHHARRSGCAAAVTAAAPARAAPTNASMRRGALRGAHRAACCGAVGRRSLLLAAGAGATAAALGVSSGAQEAAAVRGGEGERESREEFRRRAARECGGRLWHAWPRFLWCPLTLAPNATNNTTLPHLRRPSCSTSCPRRGGCRACGTTPRAGASGGGAATAATTYRRERTTRCVGWGGVGRCLPARVCVLSACSSAVCCDALCALQGKRRGRPLPPLDSARKQCGNDTTT